LKARPKHRDLNQLPIPSSLQAANAEGEGERVKTSRKKQRQRHDGLAKYETYWTGVIQEVGHVPQDDGASLPAYQEPSAACQRSSPVCGPRRPSQISFLAGSSFSPCQAAMTYACRRVAACSQRLGIFAERITTIVLSTMQVSPIIQPSHDSSRRASPTSGAQGEAGTLMLHNLCSELVASIRLRVRLQS
jgi:hypothetical protein